jgi:ubiquinol-cytochrome c reductase iron-sulfur subunit
VSAAAEEHNSEGRPSGAPPGAPQAFPWPVLVCFALTAAGAVGFAASYWVDAGTEALGATFGGALAFLALGLALWSRAIDAGEPEYVEQRSPLRTAPSEYDGFRAALAEQPVRRSGVLWSMLGLSAFSLGGAALFPLRSLYFEHDVSPDEALSRTDWLPGRRLVDDDGLPVKPVEVGPDSVITVHPEGVDPGKEVDTVTVLVRIDPVELDLPPERTGWDVDGVVAYSKLCTHAGCPVGLYVETRYQLLCPCHHSIFDTRRAADPIEGPASRPLPQLPLDVDEAGYLVARGDFSAPVGPGWWRYPE